MVSIQHLPEELLVTIFEQCSDPPPASLSHFRTVLALVSRHWHIVVYRTSSLWTCIHHHDTGIRNTLAISKSSNRPLDVVFQTNRIWSKEVEESLRDACSTISRWRSAALLFWTDGDVVRLLTVPAPLIESVDLMIAGVVREKYFIDLFGGQADRLQSLRLCRVSIPWDSAMLSNLRRLELSHIRSPQPSPTLDQLLFVLSSSPNLSVLKLDDVDIPGDLPLRAISPVRLPELSELRFRSISPRSIVTSYLLHHINGPPCKSLSIEAALDETTPASISEGISPFIPHVTEGKMEISLVDSSLYCTLGSPQGGFDILLYNHPFPGPVVLSSLVSVFRPDIIALEVTARLDHIRDVALGDLLDALSPLKIVALDVGEYAGANRVLQELSAVDTTRHWRFPHMRELTINATDLVPENVVRMVEARYGRRMHAEDDLPIPLTRLVIKGPRRRGSPISELSAVARIVGVEQVVWEFKPPEEWELDSDEYSSDDDEGTAETTSPVTQ